jgi:hypothetical protein
MTTIFWFIVFFIGMKLLVGGMVAQAMEDATDGGESSSSDSCGYYTSGVDE